MKNKIARWEELSTFGNVIQPGPVVPAVKDHPIKGNWKREMFRNENPVVVELGCGKGEYTTGLSNIFPGINFIGVDIKGARMWRGAKTAIENRVKNVAFLRTRIEFIDSFFAEDEVDEIWITFPDPHPGKRNSNKRLTCPWFLNKYRTFLKNNGIIHLKTDNAELYNYTKKLVAGNKLEILVSEEDFHTASVRNKSAFRKAWSRSDETVLNDQSIDRIFSIKTHYEEIFLKVGLKITYIAFRLEKGKNIIRFR